jgi:hypothetical protein
MVADTANEAATLYTDAATESVERQSPMRLSRSMLLAQCKSSRAGATDKNGIKWAKSDERHKKNVHYAL